MLEGMLRSIEEKVEEPVPPAAGRPEPPAGPAAQTALELPEEGWGYCTEFLIHGQGMDVEGIRDAIAALGNSVMVVGDDELVKVHVHTDDPSRVITLATGYGRLDRLNVGDMTSQHRRIREEAGQPPEQAEPPKPEAPERAEARPNGIGLVAVVSGAGLMEIFRGLGADVIVEGGQTMNPSIQDMLEAVERLRYDEAMLLPNNKNVVLAAGQVDTFTEKRVHVLDTHTVPQGIAAMVAFHPERTAEENLAAMHEAARAVQTIEVTHAVRDSRHNGLTVKKGDVIAVINDRLQHAGAGYLDVVRAALADIGAGDYELVTIYRGQQASDSEATSLSDAIRSTYPELEIELQSGGQEFYPFILSVE
jgi:DAK2 domain fusion protein YloV